MGKHSHPRTASRHPETCSRAGVSSWPANGILRDIDLSVSQPNPKVDAYRKYKIGIIGAGSAGLITRLIFDHLKELYGPDVDYEILEVNDNNRLGGRLYTHYFDDPAKQPHPQLRLPILQHR